jgi:hypothetical protein
MRSLVPSWNWLKCSSFSEMAEYTFTGTFTSPKLMEPVQIALGMRAVYPVRR